MQSIWGTATGNTLRTPAAFGSKRPSTLLGKIHVSYYQAFDSQPKYANNADGLWTIEIVDSQNTVGRFTRTAIDPDVRPHISYYRSTSADLEYACATQDGNKTR